MCDTMVISCNDLVNTFQHCPTEFKNLPDYFFNETMIENLKNRGLVFFTTLVPSKFITDDEYLEAIKESHWLFDEIPEDRITQEMCNLVFEMYPQSFFSLPDKFKTLELCEKAIDGCDNAIHFVPEKYLYNLGFMMRVVKKFKGAFLDLVDRYFAELILEELLTDFYKETQEFSNDSVEKHFKLKYPNIDKSLKSFNDSSMLNQIAFKVLFKMGKL